METPDQQPRGPGPLPVPRHSATSTFLSPNESGLAYRSDPALAAQRKVQKTCSFFSTFKGVILEGCSGKNLRVKLQKGSALLRTPPTPPQEKRRRAEKAENNPRPSNMYNRDCLRAESRLDQDGGPPPLTQTPYLY